MRSHGAGFPMLEVVLVFIEDLRVRLANVLAEHRYGLVPRLVVEGQQVHAKLVVDVLGDGFALVVLLGRFDAILLVLNATGDARCPVFHRCHAFLAQKALGVLLGRHLGAKSPGFAGDAGAVGTLHRLVVQGLFTPKTML